MSHSVRVASRLIVALIMASLWLPGSSGVPGAKADARRTAVPPAWSCGGPRALRILILYADVGAPTLLRNALLENTEVAYVDLFDATSTSPSLARLLPYDVVVAFSFASWGAADVIGDRLADYLDRFGIVVAFDDSWTGATGGSWLIQGRWLNESYTPFNSGGTNLFSDGTLGTYVVGHPLMADVAVLNAYLRQTLSLSTASTQVAAWNDGPPLIAAKGRAVGVSAYVGDYFSGQYSGDFDRVIVNAGYWLAACKTYTPLINLEGLKR